MAPRRGFQVIGEREVQISAHEQPLWDAAHSLNKRLKLGRRVEDMVRQIKATIRVLPDFIRPPERMVDALLLESMPDAAGALLQHTNIGTRKARTDARRYLKAGLRDHGRPDKYDPRSVLAFTRTIETIAGRQISVSRTRNRRAAPSTNDTGPPGGAMFNLLIAALNWAYATFLPCRGLTPVKPEGVLSIIRRARQKPSGRT